ncbi:MAG: hypothetical protein RBT11_12425 [Desulfobacterales bacterium]|jgi:hypothetical protein|nr:hypothetical protein [Desulfobacterales bacterium]
MEAAKTLKTLLSEANIYQTQGLLADARKKYDAAMLLIEETAGLKNREELLDGVRRKIASLQKVVYRVEKRTVTPEISMTDKELIKKLFSVSEGGDSVSAAIEGAMALAKFGLFDRAIQEFELLLDHPDRRIEVAKHILRCHMAIRSAHDPMMQYQKWEANANFPKEELDVLNRFLAKTYGMTSAVQSTGGMAPSPAPPPVAKPAAPPEKQSQPPDYDPYEDSYEDMIDMLPKAIASQGGDAVSTASGAEEYNEIIDALLPEKKPQKRPPEEDLIEDYIDYVSSVGFPVSVGPRAGQLVEIPVNLQTSDSINLIVSSAHRDVIALLKKGAKIEKLKMNSPISVSTATGIVTAAAVIDQGPRQGDCSVDLKIV